MTGIFKNYLPPKEFWPEYIVPPEYENMPSQLNLAEEFLDRHIKEGRGENPAIFFLDQKITYYQLYQSRAF